MVLIRVPGRGVRSPRGLLALATGVVVVGGLRVSRHDELWADLAGGVAYAVLVVLVLALWRPAAPAVRLALVGLGVCVLVELAQLTGLPAAVVEAVPAARYVLGTTFWAGDLAAYAVGAVLGGLLVRAVQEDADPSTRSAGPTR
ncbi:MAG: DUF2809 domain-containing protein [Actinotalea sp.]|nr:DUF2809 domain-containing protein [Actinotalea sp.]